MDNATRARLWHCLEHYDTGSPTEADVQALWRAHKALEAERAQALAKVNGWEKTHAELCLDIAKLEAERAQMRAYRVCGHVYPHAPVSQVQIEEGVCPTCEVRAQVTALEQEHAQAAPVLAAAAAWRGSRGHRFEAEATTVLIEEIDAWRTAREG